MSYKCKRLCVYLCIQLQIQSGVYICALVNWFVVFVIYSCVWRVQMRAFVWFWHFSTIVYVALKPSKHIKMPFITTNLIYPVTNWVLCNYMHHGTINWPVNHPVNINILILLSSLSLSFISYYYSDTTPFFLLTLSTLKMK